MAKPNDSLPSIECDSFNSNTFDSSKFYVYVADYNYEKSHCIVKFLNISSAVSLRFIIFFLKPAFLSSYLISSGNSLILKV